MSKFWSKGRGKLGLFKPLLGRFSVKTDTEMGPLTVERHFYPTLDGKYIALDAVWSFTGSSKAPYTEHCLFGSDASGKICFWSFTNDGKQSQGWLSEAPDIHGESICFEADMPAGRARQTYWPSESGQGFEWAVENQTKKGWNRFVHHQYLPI